MFRALTVRLISSIFPLFFVLIKNVLWEGKNLIQFGRGELSCNVAAYWILPLPSRSNVLFENWNSLVFSFTLFANGFCLLIGFLTIALYFLPLSLNLFLIKLAKLLVPIWASLEVTSIPTDV